MDTGWLIRQLVLDRVLVGVIQPRQLGFLIRQAGFPEIVPDLAARRLVQLVHPLGGRSCNKPA